MLCLLAVVLSDRSRIRLANDLAFDMARGCHRPHDKSLAVIVQTITVLAYFEGWEANVVGHMARRGVHPLNFCLSDFINDGLIVRGFLVRVRVLTVMQAPLMSRLRFLSDQFCSLIFSLSNLYFVGCVYTHRLDGNFDADWHACSFPTKVWPGIFVLAALPLCARLVQCIRRFSDSGHLMHLINVGFLPQVLRKKVIYYDCTSRAENMVRELLVIFASTYGNRNVSLYAYCWFGVLALTFCVEEVYGTRFAFYCIFNVAYSVYTLSWVGNYCL
jgi:hypothetical protein